MSNRQRGQDVATRGHNGGPPLDEEHVPEWGPGGIATYFGWRAAYRAAWRGPSPEILMRRARKAEELGLTFEEYTLEILERGRYLQGTDGEVIEKIKRRRLRG